MINLTTTLVSGAEMWGLKSSPVSEPSSSSQFFVHLFLFLVRT